MYGMLLMDTQEVCYKYTAMFDEELPVFFIGPEGEPVTQNNNEFAPRPKPLKELNVYTMFSKENMVKFHRSNIVLR